jgi:signal transduction histidine kinase/CheY-like chemotaxis protein
MTVAPDPRLLAHAKHVSQGASLFVLFVAVLVLVGWMLDLERVKGILPHLATMKANTALAFLAAGGSLWLLNVEGASATRAHRGAQACALIVMLIGLLTLGEYGFHRDLGIDQLLFRDIGAAPGMPWPGRMAAATAACFFVVGAAVLLFGTDAWRVARPGQPLALAVMVVSFLSLVGYGYGVRALYAIAPFSSVAVHTALSFLVLSVGVLAARPSWGLMRIVASSGVGGATARRLFPAVIGIPFVLGWLRLQGERGGLYGTEFGLALLVTSTTIALVILVCWSAASLDRADARHRDAEERMRQMQKLEAIGRLAGGVAHDFNNLLTVVRGRTHLLRGLLERDEAAERHVAIIERASDRATALVAQLLAFSRKQVLQPRVLDLNEVIASMEDMLRQLIGEDVALRFVPGVDLGRVKVDPGQVEQIVLNLAVNARDAMPRGGHLTLSTANIELDEAYARAHPGASPGLYVLFAASDSGAGMDEETRARVFEPFFTTKAPGKGTGLGLATVYGIVTQSGGNVWVYSEPGRGTTFKIYFPRIEEAPDVIQGSGPIAARHGTETILLVEDEQDLRDLACEILAGHGYTVLTAGDPEEALRLAELHPATIELLLTDVVMPGSSGPQLAERLLARRPAMKILFMSGYTGDAIVHHGVLEPGTPFVQKPFTPETLSQRVRETLG